LLADMPLGKIRNFGGKLGAELQAMGCGTPGQACIHPALPPSADMHILQLEVVTLHAWQHAGFIMWGRLDQSRVPAGGQAVAADAGGSLWRPGHLDP
jgi:hypothetical protein